MRAILPSLILLAASCGPHRVRPAIGTQFVGHWCFTTVGNLHVHRDDYARCPEQDAVEARQALVEKRYGVSLSGARLYIVDAYVECGQHGERMGCTAGDDMTVTDGVTVLGVTEHEMSHVAHQRSGHTDWFMDPDLRAQERDAWRRDREGRGRLGL